MQNLMQIPCSTHSVIFNAMATVHMLTQWHLPPPLTRTVKVSLFTHAHSSPLSLAAKLHQCDTNRSLTNDGWTFTRQASYIMMKSAVEKNKATNIGKFMLVEEVKVTF